GVDSIVGANLAAVLSGSSVVCGLPRQIAATQAARIGGCEILRETISGEGGIRQVLSRISPGCVVFCGPGAESCWSQSPRAAFTEEAVSTARMWARAAHEAGAPFTCISSDAVFTGPWMFHPESSRSLCDSRQARVLRGIEAAALAEHASALVVRTHVFGWMPDACGPGWIERELAGLEDGTARGQDPFRHATPMLATDFATVLEQAWQENLSGVFHIAGSERISPAGFLARIAQEFDLPVPAIGRPESLVERPQGFGCGETSLRTGSIRRAMGVSLPSLTDGVRRLREQYENGYRDRLNGSAAPPQGQAA
ncbi:MAG TPA: sugar nucleotide-binding protein, partial [Planctomycetaceae bacterium]|nr:sugar nucleotide-binding protein [Planctomycetaceae bacterium]